MAFRSNGPIMLALPPFRGVTRKLVLTAMAAFVVVNLLVDILYGIADPWVSI